MSRILVVDDEPAILRMIGAILARDGHKMATAFDGRTCLAAIAQNNIDAVILDLGLPDRDGLELIPMIQAIAQIPIIVVSARSDVSEKVAALDLGATDYVTKPFDGDELLARLRVVLRSTGASSKFEDIICYGQVQMDLAHHQVTLNNEPVTLTPKEFAVLQTLISAQGRILTHRSLLEKVWGKAHGNDIEYLRVVIRSLRLKMEDDPSQPRLIHNEPGIGYRLTG